MKQCPNCNKLYRDFDQYCFVCNYKLKYINGSDKIEYCPPKHEASLEFKSIPKCPTCGSTNISKISTMNRMVSTGLFGLASSKIGKTQKCNNCGYMW